MYEKCRDSRSSLSYQVNNAQREVEQLMRILSDLSQKYNENFQDPAVSEAVKAYEGFKEYRNEPEEDDWTEEESLFDLEEQEKIRTRNQKRDKWDFWSIFGWEVGAGDELRKQAKQEARMHGFDGIIYG